MTHVVPQFTDLVAAMQPLIKALQKTGQLCDAVIQTPEWQRLFTKLQREERYRRRYERRGHRRRALHARQANDRTDKP